MATHEVKSVNEAAILLANDLLSGITVYLSDDGRWTEHHDEAWRLTDDDAAQKAMAMANRSERDNRVVGAYLVDATKAGHPTHVRERIRVEGPSIDCLKNAALTDTRAMQGPCRES